MLAVVHAGAEAFGMSVRREIESRTGRDVAIGAVYATLDRLEAKRLIASVRARTRRRVTPGLSGHRDWSAGADRDACDAGWALERNRPGACRACAVTTAGMNRTALQTPGIVGIVGFADDDFMN